MSCHTLFWRWALRAQEMKGQVKSHPWQHLHSLEAQTLCNLSTTETVIRLKKKKEKKNCHEPQNLPLVNHRILEHFLHCLVSLGTIFLKTRSLLKGTWGWQENMCCDLTASDGQRRVYTSLINTCANFSIYPNKALSLS